MRTLARPSDRDDILRRLRAVRADSRRRWGRMSAHEMVCHLADSFRAVMGEKAVSADVTLFGRTLLKWGALYAPLPWPPGFRTRPELDQRLGGTRPGDFAADVAALAALVDVVVTRTRSLERFHPMFGRMSDAEWMRWAWLHMDHHLRQFGA